MNEIVLADEKKKLFTALSDYATMLGRLTDEQVPAAFEMTTQLQGLADEVRQRLRDRLIEQALENGVSQGDKGTKVLAVSEFTVSVIPTRTGIDPKKLEGWLRGHGKDPSAHMDSTVTLKVNQEKLAALGLTPYDTAQVKYDAAFRVDVKRATDGD